MADTTEPIVHTIYEPNTGTWQYIVADPKTRHAAIIDSVLDFDPARNEVSTKAADEVLEKVAAQEYIVDFLLETHLHADHLSAAAYLKDQLKSKQGSAPSICTGNGISKMQKLFGAKYGVPYQEWESAFDHTYSDVETFKIGELEVKVLHLPGHTPDHIGYEIGRNVFTGDSIFNPDLGTARCDFPQGSASALWQSMQRLLSLPPDYRLYTGHDYPPANRVNGEGTAKPQAFATVQEHKMRNKHVKDGTLESTFIEWRMQRDSGLNEPKLINQALQFNIRAGRPPLPTQSGDRLIHVPLKLPTGILIE